MRAFNLLYTPSMTTTTTTKIARNGFCLHFSAAQNRTHKHIRLKTTHCGPWEWWCMDFHWLNNYTCAVTRLVGNLTIEHGRTGDRLSISSLCWLFFFGWTGSRSRHRQTRFAQSHTYIWYVIIMLNARLSSGIKRAVTSLCIFARARDIV